LDIFVFEGAALLLCMTLWLLIYMLPPDALSDQNLRRLFKKPTPI